MQNEIDIVNKPKKGTLYLVSTPIGNPEDITLRALRVLRSVAVIVAEDLRIAREVLDYHKITTALETCRKRNDSDRAYLVLERLQNGADVALIVDAGTPGIADPGEELVRRALKKAIPVVAVPGASALLTALVVSGLPTGGFVFMGFPPHSRPDREPFFAAIADETRTVLLYESAARLRSTLDSLALSVGTDREIAVARDLTRPDETVFRGTLAHARRAFYRAVPRGEYTLVLAGQKK